MKQDPRRNHQEEEIIPPAEWAVAGVGLLLVCACLGFLLYKAYFVEDEVPAIECRVERILTQDKGVLVLGNATNKGGRSVAALEIIGHSGGENKRVTIDFLPARSTRSFGMFFSSHPTDDGVEFSAVGYQDP